MSKYTEKVLKHFEKICAIPHGSGNMDKISGYIIDFAQDNGLEAVVDDAKNVVVLKKGSRGYEKCEPVILQGHMDMVCQKNEGLSFDFLSDAIKILREGDFIKADGTTLGADNAIALAMIMTILESDDIAHPPIEAVFTTDEETGMHGAASLCVDNLKSKRMINLDSEDEDTLTVSCAGGSSFAINIPYTVKKARGKRVDISIGGLLGGHSGVDIDKGRENANILMGRILNRLKSVSNFDVMEISGGDKDNVITSACCAKLIVHDDEGFSREAEKIFETVKNEVCDVEKGLSIMLRSDGEGEFSVIDDSALSKMIFLLTCVPNGITAMSRQVENLVETSLNIGTLITEKDKIFMGFALRSNKASSLAALEEKMATFADFSDCKMEISGHYPPWEFRENSNLRRTCVEVFKKTFGYLPKVEAIHAGLECGIFASKIKELDCIAFGPQIYDAHTTKERLSVSSTEKTFAFLVEILKELK